MFARKSDRGGVCDNMMAMESGSRITIQRTVVHATAEMYLREQPPEAANVQQPREKIHVPSALACTKCRTRESISRNGSHVSAR
jgi:hypothetical protein